MTFQAFFKRVLNYTYAPLLLRYLSHDSSYSFNGVKLVVKAGVFHSRFFPGTKFMLSEILTFDLKNKSLVEIGCGSGLLSLTAAKHGAHVVASDIDPAAVNCTSENAKLNNVVVTAIQSDLFDNIPKLRFDYIIISPPYFRGKARNEIQRGWYYGETFDFFAKLFKQVRPFITEGSRVFMTLSEACEVKEIRELAQGEHLELRIRKAKRFWPGENYYCFELKEL